MNDSSIVTYTVLGHKLPKHVEMRTPFADQVVKGAEVGTQLGVAMNGVEEDGRRRQSEGRTHTPHTSFLMDQVECMKGSLS